MSTDKRPLYWLEALSLHKMRTENPEQVRFYKTVGRINEVTLAIASHFSTKLTVNPPLLNSASPWVTTFDDLKALYDSPFTGAVTVRTSLLKGFKHDNNVHQYAFFESGSVARAKGDATIRAGADKLEHIGLQSNKVEEYLDMVRHLVNAKVEESREQKKPSS